MSQWISAVLRVRLAWKLAGANLLIALAAIGAVAWADHSTTARTPLVLIVSAAIVAALVVNFTLVDIALRPLHALELTVQQVVDGNFDARIPASVVADRQMNRVAATVNLLLDTVSGDRVRMRRLAAAVIENSERQRKEVAHELHDSTAQMLAGVMMQLSAAIRDATNPALAARLKAMQESLSDLTEDVRVLAHGMHPRVLEDLGLPAALRELAREMSVMAEVEIIVDEASGDAQSIPLPIASALFHVAEEALANALSRSHPSRVRILLQTDDSPGTGQVTLSVLDDGKAVDSHTFAGTDGAAFAMRERLTLLNGRCEVSSVKGEGTRLIARVPLTGQIQFAGAHT